MRLIDADAFNKQVAAMTMKENYPAEKANAMMKLIDMQPTAFDKEKVIDELQRHSHNYYPSIDHYCLSQKAVNLKDAIKIIEKGGAE